MAPTPYGEPNWAAPGAATSGAPADSNAGSMADVNTGAANPVQGRDRSKCFQALISFLLIGLCASMMCLGVFAILKNIEYNDFAEWFISAYMIIFATILFLYESMWWCTIGGLNRVLRKNFGFMYKIVGKALYLIFVACLCFGINSEMLQELDWLRWFTGIAWGATGVFLIVLQLAYPDVFENYKSPTAGFGEQEANEDANYTV